MVLVFIEISLLIFSGKCKEIAKYHTNNKCYKLEVDLTKTVLFSIKDRFNIYFKIESSG